VVRFLEITTGQDYSGNVPYAITGEDPTRNYPIKAGSIRMRAAGMLARYFFGMSDPQCEIQKASAEVFIKSLPKWNVQNQKGSPRPGEVDMYYWYYATLVTFQTGGKYWKTWNEAMKDSLLQNQCKGGHADGSWPPVDFWCTRWSRPGMTALCALCLEVYYRYMPIYMCGN
jgi:hypothetical protein